MRQTELTTLDRRRLVTGLTGAAFAAPALVRAQAVFAEPPFQLGVASGEPSADGFVIWTRLAPRPLEPHGGMPMKAVAVQWEVAADDRFTRIVQTGEAVARPELAHSVHVEVAGLEPSRPYWYRFAIGSERSPPGRSRTAPRPGAPTERLRLIVAGCQHYEFGLYTAYRHISDEPFDLLYHYGDYIYEGRAAVSAIVNGRTTAPVRRHLGEEVYSLDDYRRRYAQYKLDFDLQAAHAAGPWMTTWDDHEVDSNWAADASEDGLPPEVFNLRRTAAAQAYYEHMPFRRSAFPAGPSMQLFRRTAWGDLVDLHFLDTRQYRSDQPCGDGNKAGCADADRPTSTMLGERQERWLYDGLAAGKARWNLLAQQVMMMPLDRRSDGSEGPPIAGLDTWSGCAAARRRLVDQVHRLGLKNVVVATGDEHRNCAGEIQDAAGRAAMVEFVGTSITSGGDGADRSPAIDRTLARNPHCRFINNQRGYLACDVDAKRWRTEFKVVDKVSAPGGALSTRAVFNVAAGEAALQGA